MNTKREIILKNENMNHVFTVVNLPKPLPLSTGKLRHSISKIRATKDILNEIDYTLGKFVSTLETVQTMEARDAVQREVGILFHSKIIEIIYSMKDLLREK